MSLQFVILGLLLSAPSIAAQAQNPVRERALVTRGMEARIARGGIHRPTPDELRDTAVAFYPAVHFYYADVRLEHGGSIRMYGAVDSAGQLYLLDAPASFRLLHAAHFRGDVDSATALGIALLAARFGGQLPAEFRLRGSRAFPEYGLQPDGTRVPRDWRVTIDTEIGESEARALQIVYEIRGKDGDPVLGSRKCAEWCRTTILEP